MAGAITLRLGTVVWDGEGAEVIVWDDEQGGGGGCCAVCGAPDDDLSRLWDGVALWVALDGWDEEIASEFSIRGRRAGILDRLPGLGGREPGI